MREIISADSYLVHHDPVAIVGLLLIGLGATLFIHIQLKMIRAGYQTSYTFFRGPFSPNGWDVPAQYLKVCNLHGWSAWPVYILFPATICGILLFVFGLFQL